MSFQGLTINKYAFVHCVFLRFLWLSNWAVVISLNNNNQVIFAMEKLCVFSKVQNEV